MKTILEPDQVAQKHHYHCDWQLSLSFNRLVAAERAAAPRRAAPCRAVPLMEKSTSDDHLNRTTAALVKNYLSFIVRPAFMKSAWLQFFYCSQLWFLNEFQLFLLCTHDGVQGRLVKKLHVGIFLPSPACGFKWKVRKCLQFHNNIKFFIQQNIKKDNKANV